MDKNGWYCILTKGGALSSYVESLAESAATYIPFAESRILWDTYLVSTYLLHGMWIHVYLFVNPWNFLFLSCFFNFYLHFSPSPFNTSYLTDSYISFTLKLESGQNFCSNRSIKSSTYGKKNIFDIPPCGSHFLKIHFTY